MLFKSWFLSKSWMMAFLSALAITMLFMSSNTTFISMNVMPHPSFLNILIMIDKQSLIFLSTVGLVSSIVILFSFHYLKNSESENCMKKFLLTLLLFIFSMFIMSTSANMFWLMIGWDGLGISSFCLIVFYQNWKSFSSGMVTFLSNRLGDSLIIICIVWLIMNKSSNSWMISNESIIFFMILALGAYSKSAQMPYLFWLPQAMAAPTPVSALVHSSTLVAAGVYTLCRFGHGLDLTCSMLLFFISFTSIIIAGTSSLMEFDLKKIIAFSTLCHISMMMSFSILGDNTSSLIHLIAHAFFKSFLFMIAGLLIHMNMNFQDIRNIKISFTDIYISFPLLTSMLSMMGVPFLSGFYSKEILMIESSFNLPSIVMFIMFMTNSFFSCAYSLRIISFLFLSNVKLSQSTFEKTWITSLIFVIGSILSCLSAGMILFFIFLEEEENIQPNTMKVILILFCTLGCLQGMSTDSLMKKPKNFLIESFSSTWKSNYIYKVYQYPFFLSSSTVLWKTDEKGMMKSSYFYFKKTNFSMSKSVSYEMMKEPMVLMKIIHITALVFIMELC